jgi:MFS transporter, DHA1 family, tetracycline resistance protein
MKDGAMTPPSRGPAFFVLVTIFIDAIGFGIAMPVIPRLIMQVGDTDIAGAIAIGGWMTLAYAAAQFICAPIAGNLSDRFGRRPILLLALAGLAADYVLMALAHTIPLLFIGRIIGGMLGGSYSTAQAALADITPPDERARIFGFVGAAFGIGFVIGPAIGGLLGELGERAPFYAAAALAGINFLYGYFIFPETLKVENRRPFQWRRANPLGAWRAMRALPGMAGAAGVLLLWQIASLVYPLTWSFFGIARFGWSNAMIGLSLAMVGLTIAIAQVFLTGRAVKRLGERGAATLGLVSATAGFILYAFATQTWMAFAILVFVGFQSMVQPSLMAMLSRRATADTQGEVQGISSMALGIGSLIAPLLFNPVMAHFTADDAPMRFAGAAFIVATVFGVITLVALRMLPKAPATDKKA